MALLNKRVRRQCCHRVHPSSGAAQRKKDEPIRPSSVIRSRGENEEEEDDEDDDEGEERRGRKTQKVQINEANVVACLADRAPSLARS